MKKLILIIILGLVSLVLIVGLAGYLIFKASEKPVTESDRQLVVRASDLIPYFEDFNPSEEYESLKRLKYFVGTQELLYEYDSQLDGDPYINNTVTYDTRASDALMTYSIEWSAQAVTFKVYGMYLEEDDSIYNPEGKSKFGNIFYEGEPVGHVFVYQKKNTVYAFTISGFIMQDPEIWHELFDHRLEAL